MARSNRVAVSIVSGAIAGILLAIAISAEAQIKPIAEQFQPDAAWFSSKGGPIDEFHCEPVSAGKHPIVTLIHGCAPQGFGDDEFKQMCVSLAEHGYFAMFVEYYSRTGQPNCREYTVDGNYNPGATHTIPEDVLDSRTGIRRGVTDQ